jgi:hypothetical protein
VRFIGGGDEIGFFAFGQVATGVIAFGQMATGVIAVGQLARGVVAVGQLAVGVWAVGQVAVGVGWAAGIAIGGNGSYCLPIVPRLEPLRDYPPCTTFEAVSMGWGDGWVNATLHVEQDHTVSLYSEKGRLPVKVACRLLPRAMASLQRGEGGHVLAHVRHMGHVLVCDRLMSVPIPTAERPGFYGGLTFRMIVLIGMAILVWAVALHPVLQILERVF